MTIKIKIDGRKYVVCTDCGIYYRSQSGKKQKKTCSSCTQKVAVL